MKLLVDARSLTEEQFGGVSRVGRALLAEYAATFPEDEIVCVTTGWIRPRLPDELHAHPNVTHQHVRIPNKLLSILATAYRLPPTAYSIDALFLPNLGFVGKLPRNLPTVLLLHDLSFLIESRWFPWKQRLWHHAVRAKYLIRSATHLLAVSETTKRDAMRLLEIPEERITVIPIGRTLAEKSRLENPDSARQAPSRNLLLLGLGDPRKNIPTAIEAVRRLREEEKFRDVTLTIVEAGQARTSMRSPPPRNAVWGKLRRRSVRVLRDENVRQEEWIHVINRPTDEELLSLYKNAAALLYPSWYEGYGLPLHEAAALGVPRIASTAGALPETAPVYTLFADPAKPHHWTMALRLILQSPVSEMSPVPCLPDEALEAESGNLSPVHFPSAAELLREACISHRV